MTQIIMAASAPALSAKELMFEVVVEGGEESAAVDDGGGDTAVWATTQNAMSE